MIKRSLRNFPAESDVTKLQILNTACKLYVKDPARAGPALKHVLDLCAADPSVDIRDRVRVYRAMFAVGGNATPLAVFKERVVLCEKSAPQLPSPAAPTCAHALGSLSHTVEHLAPGYVPLPPHPTTQPPTHVRDQYFAGNQDSSKAGRSGGAFYSDDSDDSDSDSDGSSYESSDYTSDDDSMSDSDSDSDADSDSDSDDDSRDDSDSDSNDDSGSEDESEEEEEESDDDGSDSD